MREDLHMRREFPEVYNMKKLLIEVLGVAVLGLWFLASWFYFADAQVIEGHETIEYSMVITYIGPIDAINYDTKFIQDTMREAPIIYCEGDFTFQTIIDNDKRIEVVCTYDWSADGSGTH